MNYPGGTIPLLSSGERTQQTCELELALQLLWESHQRHFSLSGGKDALITQNPQGGDDATGRVQEDSVIGRCSVRPPSAEP